MKDEKIKILCTLGPASLNKKFLRFAKGKVTLIRLNMSHIEIKNLPSIIKFLKKNCNIPICLDTEGAQIRTKVKKSINYRLNQTFKIKNKSSNFNLYPNNVTKLLKINDKLDIGFNDLKVKVISIKKNFILLKTISAGLLSSNKGVHVINRSIKLNFITEKDKKAINIAKSFKIKNFALSFINSTDDIKKFNKLLKNENKIYKIETRKAIENINEIIKSGNQFLIDRGDLSKETTVELIPYIQRKIFKISKKYKGKKIYVATNLLESMIVNKYPTRGEANDIFNSLEMGASGLVLAAETAIGKYPRESIVFLKKMINTYVKYKTNY